MRVAFKEWAIVVQALGQGEQTVILRKGGIHEGAPGFQVKHREFFLFPTFFHQQEAGVVRSAQGRLAPLLKKREGQATIPLEYWAKVEEVFIVRNDEALASLRPYHIWSDETISDKFEWGKEKALTILLLRVFRLRKIFELPDQAGYAGCKSWIQTTMDVAVSESEPVLTDREFTERSEAIRHVLEAPYV